MLAVQKIMQNQVMELVGLMLLGLLLGIGERKFSARDNSAYKDYRIDLLAVTILFFESALLVFATENLKTLEILHSLQTSIRALPWFVLIIGTSLLADFINYFLHRLLHSEHFWRFHRWHHSPNQLFWFSGFRGSFVHIFILGFKNTLFLTLSDVDPWVLATLGVQGTLSQMLGHLNFDIHIPVLSKFVVMPQYHRIHHATDRTLHDSNYGFFWTFWDRIFSTQTLPEKTKQNFRLGIPETEKVELLEMITG